MTTRDLGGNATGCTGGNAAAFNLGADASPPGGNAAEPPLLRPMEAAPVATRAELLRRLRRSGLPAAAMLLLPGTTLGANAEHVPREAIRQRCIAPVMEPIRQRRGGVAADSVHAGGVCSAAVDTDAELTGCSADSVPSASTFCPVRLSAPAVACDSFTASSPCGTESVLVRRRLRGKQNAGGKPQQHAGGEYKGSDRDTATATAAATAREPAAPRDGEPPTT